VNSVAFFLAHNNNKKGYKFMPQVLASELRVMLAGSESPVPCDR